MDNNLEEKLLHYTQGDSVVACHEIQALWSNYGAICRYEISGATLPSIIVKHIKLPKDTRHPRGWNTERSHQRKIRSYQVEMQWYQNYSKQCDLHSRTPTCYGCEHDDNTVLLFLEDLDASGFPQRIEHASLKHMNACLRWLAYFHARFINYSSDGLWPYGTYWHLSTRPDELEALDDVALKKAAHKIDERLNLSPFQTLVHGDAKLANFCFSESGLDVAAVDFQYIGKGCGMKDVAYFIGSCLSDKDCDQHTEDLLDRYFHHLKQALSHYRKAVDPEQVEADWRPLFAYAWADFHRFIKGWSPGHWKIHDYSERITKGVIADLEAI